jgi:hypothetical protein
MVFQRCSGDEEMDSNAACRLKDDCSAQCSGGAGEMEASLGVCACADATTAKDICDKECIATLPQVSFSVAGDIAVTDPVTNNTETFSRKSLTTLFGSARCQLQETTDCKILNLGKDASNGDFTADFQAPALLGSPRRSLHSHRYMQSGGTANTQKIRNPVVCATAGSAIIFEEVSKANYPVYQKNSLLNTNKEFDYGSFVVLGEGLTNGSLSATAFIFKFDEAGIYVFRDSANLAKEIVVAIMTAGGQCPTGLIYEAKEFSSLLTVGASLSTDITLTPDWTFFFASLAAFFFLIFLSAITISYIYNKNWDQDPARQAVKYQDRQYKKVKRSDIDDEKALVSINSEASSLQFRQQGKQEAAFKVKGLEEDDGKKETVALDLDRIEKLKDGLAQQLEDINVLYSEDK